MKIRLDGSTGGSFRSTSTKPESWYMDMILTHIQSSLGQIILFINLSNFQFVGGEISKFKIQNSVFRFQISDSLRLFLVLILLYSAICNISW